MSREVRRNSPWFAITLGVSLIIVIGGVLAAVLIPLLLKLPKKINRSINITTSILENSENYDYDPSSHVLSILGDDDIKISTPNSNSGIGVEPDYNYLFSNPDGADSEINITFVKEETLFAKINFTIKICDELGENITTVQSDKVIISEVNNGYNANVKVGYSLYIKEFTISYQYLVYRS